MKRILLLMAVAALMLAVTASSALAVAREPTSFDGPGEASDAVPTENKAEPTKDTGSNCYGQINSNDRKGPRGNPGSLAVPTIFDPDGPEGPEPAGPNYTGHAVSSLEPGQISGFQEEFREAYAGESEC